MESGIEQFLKYLKKTKHYSDNTISAYQSDLAQFAEFLRARGVTSWSRLTTEHITAFWTDLRVSRSLRESTVARKLASVRSFSHHLVRVGTLQADPTETLSSPQVTRRTPRTLSDHEVSTLIQLPARNPKPKGLRDRAILELLYSTGMRVSELTALDLADVDLGTGTVTCGERSTNLRTISMSSTAREAMSAYLESGRGHMVGSETEKALFVNHRGERLSRQGLWLVIKEYADQLGLEGNVTPHTLRHSAAAHRIRRGANLSDVQRLLGHSSPTSTQVYARIARSASNRGSERQ